MATFSTDIITNEDYQNIRRASMKGGFVHTFWSVGGTTFFNTKTPYNLCKELQEIISLEDNSWNDILEVGNKK